jgi:short-subunit dehydrogenase
VPRRPPLQLAGGVAVVTGAARGMGLLHAERAVAAGATAVLLDRDEEALAQAVARLREGGAAAHGLAVDVAHPGALADAAAAVERAHGPVQLLVNNAGVVSAGWSWEVDAADTERTLRVNALAPMHLTRALLPAMIADASAQRRVLTVASASAAVPVPRMAAYAGSKAALLAWGEALRLELARAGHHHVGVTTFCPSFVDTGMFAGASQPRLTPVLTPASAVARAWRGMLAGAPVVMAPASVRLGAALRGVLPVPVFDVVADRAFGVHATMERFTGRR